MPLWIIKCIWQELHKWLSLIKSNEGKVFECLHFYAAMIPRPEAPMAFLKFVTVAFLCCSPLINREKGAVIKCNNHIVCLIFVLEFFSVNFAVPCWADLYEWSKWLVLQFRLVDTLTENVCKHNKIPNPNHHNQTKLKMFCGQNRFAPRFYYCVICVSVLLTCSHQVLRKMISTSVMLHKVHSAICQIVAVIESSMA